VRLSSGQKQRVALARALLKDADSFPLDEAISDLDTNIEKTVHDAVELMERNYVMLVIATVVHGRKRGWGLRGRHELNLRGQGS